MESAPILMLKGISKAFSGVQALSDVSFEMPVGGAHALIGENGAGKSTLLKILSANERADAGEIRIGGETMNFDGPRAARSAGIAMIHQELQLVPYMTVAQNLFLGDVPTRYGFTDRRLMEERGRKALAELNASVDVRARVQDLSVADKQLVEIARALLWNARIVAMDEPTSALTDKEFLALEAVIRRIRAKGVAIIYVSHKLDEVSRVCETGTVLRDGKVVAQIRLREHSNNQIISLMVGREISFRKRERRSAGEVILEARDLFWRDRVRGVSVAVRRGEVLGVAGLVGSGRTELVRLLAGVERPDRGSILLRGKAIAFKSRSRAMRMGLGLVPEDRKKEAIIPLRSVLANVALPVVSRYARLGLIVRRRLRSECRRQLEDVALRPMQVEKEIRKFSGGNQQKAIIARWLLADCEVFILDEPTRGIDVGAKQEVYDLIDELADRGKAVVVVSSELPEILRLSDRVLVIREGAGTGILSNEGLTENSILELAVPSGVTKKSGGSENVESH